MIVGLQVEELLGNFQLPKSNVGNMATLCN